MRKSLYSIFIVLISIAGFCINFVYADDSSGACDIKSDVLLQLLPGLSAEEVSILMETGELTHFYSEEDFNQLTPDRQFKNTIRKNLQKLEPTLGVEALFLLNLDEIEIESPGFELELFNTLTSISTMEGIEYFSASRNRMRLFFEQSYVIDSKESKQRIDDPVFNSIPTRFTLLAYQKDLSFGKNIQEVTYSSGNDTFLMSMKNLTTMFYGIIPLIPPEQMIMELFLIPQDNCLIFYGNAGVRVTVIPGIEKKSQNSFYNRIKALYSWFKLEIRKELPL